MLSKESVFPFSVCLFALGVQAGLRPQPPKQMVGRLRQVQAEPNGGGL